MKQILKRLAITATSLIIILGLMSAPALALNCSGSDSGTTACTIQGGVNTAGGGADNGNAGDHINNILVSVINILSLVIGIAAVIVIIIAGLSYVTSGGDSSKTATAKNTILYAVIGLVIVAFAQVIVKFVVHTGSPNAGVVDPGGSIGGSSSSSSSSSGHRPPPTQ